MLAEIYFSFYYISAICLLRDISYYMLNYFHGICKLLLSWAARNKSKIKLIEMKLMSPAGIHGMRYMNNTITMENNRKQQQQKLKS